MKMKLNQKSSTFSSNFAALKVGRGKFILKYRIISEHSPCIRFTYNGEIDAEKG